MDDPLSAEVKKLLKRLPRYSKPSAKRGKRKWSSGVGAGYTRSPKIPKYLKVGELRFLDNTIGLTNCGTAGTFLSNSLNVIVQGDEAQQRTGRLVTVRSVYIKGVFELPAAASTDASDVFRLILGVNKQTNGLTLPITDLLQTANFLSHRNIFHMKKIRILFDSYGHINSTGGSDGTASRVFEHVQRFNKFIKVNIPIQYEPGGTGAITEQTTNNLFLFAISRLGLINFEARIRLRFTD